MIVRHARALLRLVVLVKVTSALYVVGVLRRLLALRRMRDDVEWRATVFSWWCRFVLRLLGAGVSLTGRPPQGPFVLVSNHQSYLDVVLLGAVAPSVFIAKSDVARWPVIGALARWNHTLFLDRGLRTSVLRVGEQARALLENHVGLVLFPEGTSTGGDRLLPFKSSLLQVPVRARMPVWYACVDYRSLEGEPPASESLCWWRDMLLVGHLYRLLQLPGFEASVRLADEPVRGENRKELARELWRRIDGLRAGRVRPGTTMNQNAELIEANVALLERAQRLIEALDDRLFVDSPAGRPGGTVGAQLRHVLEFYEAFLGGREQGRVDYDARPRDRRVETDRQRASAKFARLIERLRDFAPSSLPPRLLVKSDAAAAGGDAHVWGESSGLRELQFLLSHTVHHYALIALLLHDAGFSVEPDFGIAPSTLAHRQRLAGSTG